MRGNASRFETTSVFIPSNRNDNETTRYQLGILVLQNSPIGVTTSISFFAYSISGSYKSRIKVYEALASTSKLDLEGKAISEPIVRVTFALREWVTRTLFPLQFPPSKCGNQDKNPISRTRQTEKDTVLMN
jgi:Uma2 family endonuclease